MSDQKEGLRLLRRVAIECRKLAGECAEGTAPKLKANDFGRDGYHCAMGLVLARAGHVSNPWEVFDSIANVVSPIAGLETDENKDTPSTILIDANNDAHPRKRHAAVVFPLLNFADACDRTLKRLASPVSKSAARSAPETESKS